MLQVSPSTPNPAAANTIRSRSKVIPAPSNARRARRLYQRSTKSASTRAKVGRRGCSCFRDSSRTLTREMVRSAIHHPPTVSAFCTGIGRKRRARRLHASSIRHVRTPEIPTSADGSSAKHSFRRPARIRPRVCQEMHRSCPKEHDVF